LGDPDGEDPDGEDPEVPEGEGEEEVSEEVDEPKWYETKTMQITVAVALSASTIALLLFIF